MGERNSFEDFCVLVGGDPEDPSLTAWFAAALSVPEEKLDLLARAFAWLEYTQALDSEPPERWISHLLERNAVTLQSRECLQHLLEVVQLHAREKEDRGRFLSEVLWREQALSKLDHSSLDHLASALFNSTEKLIAALQSLRDPGSGPIYEDVSELFPELIALVRSRPIIASIEHENTPGRSIPLLEHLVDRTLARKLRGLELGDREIFQHDSALSEGAFSADQAALARVYENGLATVLRAALTFLDFTKGGTDAQRAQWVKLGADLSVHNKASATVLAKEDSLRRIPRLRGSKVLQELTLTMVRHHGLLGQTVRGETPLIVFAELLDEIRGFRGELAQTLGLSERDAVDLCIDLYHLVNALDTAGVREGLYGDRLRFEMAAVESLLMRLARLPEQEDIHEALRRFDRDESDAESDRELRRIREQWLFDRLSRLRSSRLRQGEPSENLLRHVQALSDNAVESLVRGLEHLQLWYCEVATAGLSPGAQLKFLTLCIHSAADCGVDIAEPYHVTFAPLVETFGDPRDPAWDYRIRIVEALLRKLEMSSVFGEKLGLDALSSALGTFAIEIGTLPALAIDFDESEEARALLTLLPTYERKSSASFHSTLKSLCDLYGLRKDDFDRISNEALYLEHMNSARSDKERMLDWVIPGRIIEIGPGGGVVLDLVASRFRKSEVLGVDVSSMVVEELEHRKEREGRTWSIVEGDAFELADVVEADSATTIILCSLLHEIYSYCEFEQEDGTTARFRLESVRNLLRSCFDCLRPGGRIIIRDGVMPQDEPRIIEFLDPNGPDFFRRFQQEFEGRKIRGDWLHDNRLALSAPDAMEFLYCYTWGPASFPYEVREQYGVLPYLEYRESILAWLKSGGRKAHAVELPDEMASYLQPGYRDGLEDKVRLLDHEGQQVELPDSNCLMVFEKG